MYTYVYIYIRRASVLGGCKSWKEIGGGKVERNVYRGKARLDKMDDNRHFDSGGGTQPSAKCMQRDLLDALSIKSRVIRDHLRGKPLTNERRYLVPLFNLGFYQPRKLWKSLRSCRIFYRLHPPPPRSRRGDVNLLDLKDISWNAFHKVMLHSLAP